MFLTAMLAGCLTVALGHDSFDIEVAKVAPIAQGQPIRVEVTLTYRGDRPLCVANVNYKQCCLYTLPAGWKATPKQGPVMSLQVGISEVRVKPGDKIRHTVDVRRDYEVTETPGGYEIEIQGLLHGEFVPNGPATLYRSVAVKVPVVIVPPGTKQ